MCELKTHHFEVGTPQMGCKMDRRGLEIINKLEKNKIK